MPLTLTFMGTPEFFGQSPAAPPQDGHWSFGCRCVDTSCGARVLLHNRITGTYIDVTPSGGSTGAPELQQRPVKTAGAGSNVYPIQVRDGKLFPYAGNVPTSSITPELAQWIPAGDTVPILGILKHCLGILESASGLEL